jgi:excisionase family DNA binding protein
MPHNPVADYPVQSALVGQLFTTFEVSQLFKVSQRTVQIWIRSGALRAVRYGRILRVREADLAAFGEVLNQHPAPSMDVSPSPAPAGAAQE